MATLYFLEYQKRSSLEWTAVASNGMLAIRPVHPSTASSTPNYDPRYNSLLDSTLSSSYTKHGSHSRGLDSSLSVKTNAFSTQAPHTKQQLYSQEITWYPISHSGPQPKLEKNRFVIISNFNYSLLYYLLIIIKNYRCKQFIISFIPLKFEIFQCVVLNYFSEFPGNWLGRHGAGAIPSNVDENDQGSEVDSSLNKGPIPLGRPSNCPRHFSEFENPCQVTFSRIESFILSYSF